MNKETLITKENIKTILPKRKQNSHKGIYGSILNIAGSKNYRGAAFLSTISALKTGAGYISLAAINEVINSVSILCPEAVFIPLESQNSTIAQEEYKKIIKISENYKVIEVGCGLSCLDTNKNNIEQFFKNFINEIKNTEKPVIIDADGINIISELKITKLPKNTVLTPHPMELSRLLNIDALKIQNERTKYAKIAAQKYNVIIVLKGENTIITDGENLYINKTGNSALSKAGTGDVLTGMISGFCAQGASPLNSAILSVYLHGLAGEIASQNLTQYCVNASDLIDYIPMAIKTVL